MYARDALENIKYDHDNRFKVAEGVWFQKLNGSALFTPEVHTNYVLNCGPDTHILCIESHVDIALGRLDYKIHHERNRINALEVAPGVTFVRFQKGLYLPHKHPDQDETAIILYGSARFETGEKCQSVCPGEVIDIPAGTSHGLNTIDKFYLLSLMVKKQEKE